MSEIIASTVAFKSNLQPVHGSYLEDRRFLSSIHDIFALEKLKKTGIDLTTLQMQEYRSASLHCAYAYADDYPFGTVRDSDGKEFVTCKCINTKCRLFHQCRPDFDPTELMPTEENVSFIPRIADVESAIIELSSHENDTEQRGDYAAAIEMFSHTASPERHTPSPDIPLQDTTEPVVPLQPSDEKPNKILGRKDESGFEADASFASFEVVQQDEIIQSPLGDRIVVNAGPGTGKTWTLIEKIKYMLVKHETDPANILVLCFSRAAVEVIRYRLEQAAVRDELPPNWHQIDVRTFDSFATYLLAWVIDNIPEMLPDKYSLERKSYDERIHTAADVLKRDHDLLAEYEHVIVDEVQDLVGVRAEMVLALLNSLPESCGFTLLGDSCQALYDYLAINDDSVMSSEQFYKAIFHIYRYAKFYALDHNFRQGDEFGTLAVPYRNAILTGDQASRNHEANVLNSSLTLSNIDLRRISPLDINRFLKAGSLGILCRTNGQALQISTWLRAEGIEHLLQRPAQSQDIAAWVARVLMNAETDVIDENEFGEVFSRYYPEASESYGRYWDALTSTQIDQTRTHYEIEDILKGILQNARNPLLFEEPRINHAAITVSNIHRAKGREFDSVLILQDVLDNMGNEENSDILEHKVCYVALTRPKKTVEKVAMKQQYIYISKDASRRCFKAGGFANRKYLSHIEIVDGNDIDIRTYGSSTDIQDYIQSMSPDTRLKLLKCPEEASSYVLYRLVPEDDIHIVLGYTTLSFAMSLEQAIQRIFNSSRTIAYKYYPNIFGDVYFDQLVTCISTYGVGIPGAKRFGNMYIWYGASISAFAQMEKDRY